MARKATNNTATPESEKTVATHKSFDYSNAEKLLEVKHLTMHFPINVGLFKTKPLKAVDDVSFSIKRGETVGLVGESGCGKTTLGRTILQLYQPTGGKIVFNGQRVNPPTKLDISEITKKINESQEFIDKGETRLNELIAKGETDEKLASQIEIAKQRVDHLNHTIMRAKKGKKHYKKLLMEFRKHAQMVFQDPYSSLDPRMTVEDIIAEPLDAHKICKTKEERHQRVEELMKAVGLSSEHATRYAHEFSGGQRQRIGIARSLALNPEFIVCDEPVSALDVSIQAQVINLMNELREKMGLTIMFIAHDLSVVKYFCDRIAVMYFGEMVELATSEELFKHPLHPYAKALLSAIPKPDPLTEKTRKRIVYDPKKSHDYSKEKPTLQEIVKGHWILANSKEMEKYRKEIKELDAKRKNKKAH